MAWSGGCRCWRTAKSSGARPNFVLLDFVGLLLLAAGGLALLWLCIFRDDYAFDTGIILERSGDVCRVACV